MGGEVHACDGGGDALAAGGGGEALTTGDGGEALTAGGGEKGCDGGGDGQAQHSCAEWRLKAHLSRSSCFLSLASWVFSRSFSVLTHAYCSAGPAQHEGRGVGVSLSACGVEQARQR